MSEQRKPVVTPNSIGALAQMVRTLRLVWRLLNDPRVPTLTKWLIPAVAVYFISPIDPFPELLVPGVGYLDDLGVLVAGIALFIELCPHHVVEEHRRAIAAEAGAHPPAEDNVIDGTSRSVPPDDSQTPPG